MLRLVDVKEVIDDRRDGDINGGEIEDAREELSRWGPSVRETAGRRRAAKGPMSGVRERGLDIKRASSSYRNTNSSEETNTNTSTVRETEKNREKGKYGSWMISQWIPNKGRNLHRHHLRSGEEQMKKTMGSRFEVLERLEQVSEEMTVEPREHALNSQMDKSKGQDTRRRGAPSVEEDVEAKEDRTILEEA
ncbi:hypothetical protein J5N97_026984 [Dioscorea zingiberensis]|uniref:Uncharacterized protein n=1 Tax=Dioscorea zingiberensis TaxID=325984 RepID=A0A9D5C360_9LILI|nr:hypothetical protein J5N97_026984 [Dioscorea zingiberensis]